MTHANTLTHAPANIAHWAVILYGDMAGIETWKCANVLRTPSICSLAWLPGKCVRGRGVVGSVPGTIRDNCIAVHGGMAGGAGAGEAAPDTTLDTLHWRKLFISSLC